MGQRPHPRRLIPNEFKITWTAQEYEALYHTWLTIRPLARIIVIEKALEERVELIEAKTRAPGSPYYDINPSSRVPYPGVHIPFEEAKMRRQFGAVYDDYIARVRRWI